MKADEAPIRLRATRAAHFVPDAIAIVLLACGVWMRLAALPAVPLFEWDTRGWLEPALGWLGGGGFRESCEREWIYGAFLALCLKFGGGFSAVVWCQWVLGIVGGVCLWLTWRIWSGMLPGAFSVRVVAVMLGWLALAAYVLNPNIVVFEMSLRPEALLGVTVLAAMLLATGFVRARWTQPGPWRAERWALLLPALAAAVVTLKPSWALSFPVLVSPLLLGCLGPPKDFWKNARPLALGAVAAIAAVVVPERLLFQRGEKARVVLPMTLLTIHANAVIPALAAERDDPGTPPARRELLASALPVLESDFAASKNVPIHYHRLGFDPDFIMYRGALFPHLVNAWGYDNAHLAAFCNRAYIEAWRREPAKMLAKVFSQLGYFAFPDARTFSKSKVDLGPLLVGSLEVAGDGLGKEWGGRVREMCAAYLEDLRSAAARERVIRPWKPLDEVLRKRVPPAIWAGVAITAVVLVSLLAPAFRALRLPALLAAFYLAVPAANALTVSLVHALDNNRYRMSYGPVLFFAICAAAALVFAAAWVATRRAARPS